MNVYVLPALPTELCFHDWHCISNASFMFVKLIFVDEFIRYLRAFFIRSNMALASCCRSACSI